MIGRPGINLYDLFHLIILDTSLKLVIRKGEAHTHRVQADREFQKHRKAETETEKDTHTNTQTDRQRQETVRRKMCIIKLYKSRLKIFNFSIYNSSLYS